jgi:hypothetical protein
MFSGKFRLAAPLAVVLVVLLLASAAASGSGGLPFATARSEVKSWLLVQARIGPVEGAASLGSVRAEKCRRLSRSHVVCDGLVYWRRSRHPDERAYVCLFRGVSVRLKPGGFAVGQHVGESRCADTVRIAESMTGFH